MLIVTEIIIIIGKSIAKFVSLEKYRYTIAHQRCVTLGSYLVQENIDSSNKIYQHIDNRIIDYL